MFDRSSAAWLVVLCSAALLTLASGSPPAEPLFADSSLPKNRSPVPISPVTGRGELHIGKPKIVSRQAGTDMVHSATVTELTDGRLMAAWFGGSREGAGDVAIYASYFDPQAQQWSQARAIVTRESAEHSLNRYIRKLGNPVLTRLGDGRLALFYVSVSIGGWATSQVNMAISSDNGATWPVTHHLITSPFFNLSTLVKGTPYLYNDGTVALPVYHELAGKFGELLRITAEGDILSKSRLSEGREGIQPVLLPYNRQEALALLRDTGDEAPYKALMTRSHNGGAVWDEPDNASFYNPNSALSGVVLDCGRMLTVANDTRDERSRLTLLISEDRGATWKPLFRIEDSTEDGEIVRRVPREQFERDLLQTMAKEGFSRTQQNHYLELATGTLCGGDGCRFRYDYPYLIKSRDGTIHLVYTWNKAYIKHRAFSQEWLYQWI